MGISIHFKDFILDTKDVFNIVEYRDPLDSNINVETTENIGESHSYGLHSNNNIKNYKMVENLYWFGSKLY